MSSEEEVVDAAQAGSAMPEFDPTSTGSGDSRATEEALKIAAGDDLERDGKQREHKRHQKFRDHANIAVLILFWLIIISLGVGVMVFTWHLLTPACWHFLNDSQMEKLQTILASALLSSALTGYAKQRLS